MLMENLDENFGVLSLSRTEKSLLMWAHYTNSHTGFVIAFDDSHQFFNLPDAEGKATKPHPVIYSEKRNVHKTSDSNFYTSSLCSKPLEWAYEEEERVFRVFTTQNTLAGKDDNGKKIHLACFPPEAILAIYIGFNSNKNTEKRIIAAVKKHKLICNIYKSEMHQTEYKIFFKKISL